MAIWPGWKTDVGAITKNDLPGFREDVQRSGGFKKLAQMYRHLAITMAVKVEEAMDKKKDPMIIRRTYATKWKAHQKDFDKQAARYLKANI